MDRYTHGHHESVLRSHAWRTAENSASYLLDSLQPGLDLLDVGCGPGTITMDLAERVAPGRVVGIDSQSEVIARADELRQRRDRANVKFSVGDVYALRFDDARFDVVHAHQVLQHLTRPGGAGCGPIECCCHRLLTRRWNMSLPTATSSTLWQMRGGNGLLSLTVFSLFSMARCSLAGPPWTHKILWSQNELRSSQVTESGRRLFPRVFAFSRRLIQPWTSLSWIGAPIVTSAPAR